MRAVEIVIACVLVVTTFASTPAGAQKGIPIRDLPPFPDVSTEEEQLLGVTTAAAEEVEEDVVVGAAKREQSLGAVASAVTVIPGERLRRFGYRTLGEALAGVVGIYLVDDRSVERIGIRGVQLLGDANTRFLVLVDGSPVNEPWSQYVDASFALPVSLDDVARIEVVRGPVSSIYGTNAFLGIINIVTLAADKAPRAYGRSGFASFGAYQASAGFGYGSLDRQVRGTVSWLRRSGEGVDIAPDEALPTRTDHDSLEALNGSLTVTVDRLFFHVRAYDRARELPGAPYNSVIGMGGNQKRDRQMLVEAGYNLPLGRGVFLSSRAYADRYQFRTELRAQDIVDDMIVAFPFSAEGNSLWYGGELRGLVDVVPGGKLSLTAGASAERSHTDSRSLGPSVEPVTVEKDFDVFGVYTEGTSQPLSWLAATAGVRYDVNSIFDNRLSLRGAVFLHRGKRYGLKLLYTQGFRNPSIYEAFYADDYRYRPNLVDGDTSLRPEDIDAREVVLWGKPFRPLYLRASYWSWTLTDLVEKDSVMQPPPINDTRLQYKNRGHVATRGVELEALYRDTRGWIAFANVTWADVRFNFGDDPPVNAPALVASAGGSTPPLAGHVHVSTEINYVGARKSRRAITPDDPDDIDPFLGWNVVLHAPDIEGFDVTVGVRNLLGVRERMPAQSDYDRKEPNAVGGVDTLPVYTIPGPGREFFARIGYRF